MNDITNNTATQDTTDTAPAATAYAFAAYDAQHSPAPATGNRISKCLYRSDSKEALANSYIELPELAEAEVQEQLTVLMPHLISYLETVQDSIVKASHKSGYDAVQASAVALPAIIDKLESTGEGRLNKEAVFAWFDSSMADMLMVAFADKMGISDQPTEAEEERLSATLNVYRVKYGALAGGKSVYMPEEAEKLVKAIEVAGAADTSLGARFVARLNKMQEPEEDLLLSL